MASSNRFEIMKCAAAATSQVSGGTVAWVNPQYASVEDTINFAQAAFLGLDFSDWINAQPFNTTPLLTVHETVTGLGCLVNCQADITDLCRITDCQITSAGVQEAGTPTLDTTKPITDSFKYYEIGGDGEMWGLTDAQMKTFLNGKFKGFRFFITEETGAAANVDVDGMQMIVYYYRRGRVKCCTGAGL